MLQLWSKKMLSTLYYTFKIIPTPADAVVTINGETVNSVTLIEGSEISWSVSADRYAEQTGELRLSEDTVMDIVLEWLRDPLWYCWAGLPYGSNAYIYTPTPTPTKGEKYYSVGGWKAELAIQATSSSDLAQANYKILSVGSNYINVNTDILSGSLTTNFYRHPEGDLYT